jgi:glycosyltransferase involved in cell wall biosynthesis
MSDMTVEISVVVPTYNRPDFLDRCLAALVAQRCDREAYEIVIADDAASEQTQRQVEAWRERCRESGPAIHYLPVRTTRGPAAARNAGWRQASGHVIAFTDDDCLPEPDWLAAGMRAIATGASGVSGRVIVPLPQSPTDYERNAASLETAEFVTANCFYRRDVLEAVGGFDERFAAAWREDSDLYFTLLERGERLISAPDAIVVHPVRTARWGVSLGQQRKSQYNALLCKKHPELYRARIQQSPRRHYYASLGAAAGVLAGIAARKPPLLATSLAVWSGLTGCLIAHRLRGVSHDPVHVVEIALTSALIPPLAVYWRLRGAVAYRTPFF